MQLTCKCLQCGGGGFLPCAEHHPVELPPRDGGRAGGAGEQVPAAGVHQRGRHAGAAGELRGPALHQPRPADQVHPPDPQRRGAGLLMMCVCLSMDKDFHEASHEPITGSWQELPEGIHERIECLFTCLCCVDCYSPKKIDCILKLYHHGSTE